MNPFESQISDFKFEIAKWWVIHTRPRCEKKMDQWLAGQALGHYLPTRRVLRSYPSKKIEFELPLFGGYAFGTFSDLQKKAVYDSGFAAGVLEVADQGSFLRQLDEIRRVLQAGLSLQECPYFHTGQKVRIHGGELKGLIGIIKRVAGSTRLVLSVDFLQRSVAVEIDSRLLSPAF